MKQFYKGQLLNLVANVARAIRYKDINVETALDDIYDELSKINSKSSYLSQKVAPMPEIIYEGVVSPGANLEIYIPNLKYYEILIFGNESRMANVYGQVRSAGICDYWVSKPSNSTIQVSSNSNRIIIGNPSGAGSIAVYSKIYG